MAKLPILQYPHPKLAAKAEPVADFNDAIKTLVNDMAETMYAAPGVGLAANQVGILKRIVVIDITDDNSDLLVFINPEIIETKGDLVDHEEGCLSLKGLYEHVKRLDKSEFTHRTSKVKHSNLNARGFSPFVFSMRSITLTALFLSITSAN